MAKIEWAPKLTFKENSLGGLDIFLKIKLIGVIYSTTQSNWCYDLKLDINYGGSNILDLKTAKEVVKSLYKAYIDTDGFKNINFDF